MLRDIKLYSLNEISVELIFSLLVCDKLVVNLFEIIPTVKLCDYMLVIRIHVSKTLLDTC